MFLSSDSRSKSQWPWSTLKLKLNGIKMNTFLCDSFQYHLVQTKIANKTFDSSLVRLTELETLSFNVVVRERFSTQCFGNRFWESGEISDKILLSILLICVSKPYSSLFTLKLFIWGMENVYPPPLCFYSHLLYYDLFYLEFGVPF